MILFASCCFAIWQLCQILQAFTTYPNVSNVFDNRDMLLSGSQTLYFHYDAQDHSSQLVTHAGRINAAGIWPEPLQTRGTWSF